VWPAFMRRLISPTGKQINERIPGGAGPPSWSGAPAAGFSTPVVPWPGFGRSGENEKTPPYAGLSHHSSGRTRTYNPPVNSRMLYH
jgi:hypothetical protein